MSQPTVEIDLSEFEGGAVNGTGLCPIGRALDALDEDRSAKLTAALTMPSPKRPDQWRVAADRICLTMKAWGHMTSTNMVGRHRRGVCGCPTS